jgi:hypothetical protein
VISVTQWSIKHPLVQATAAKIFQDLYHDNSEGAYQRSRDFYKKYGEKASDALGLAIRQLSKRLQSEQQTQPGL